MNITIEYHGQLRHVAQMDSESRNVDQGVSIPELVAILAEVHDEAFRAIVLDETGALLPSTLILKGNELADRDNWPPLNDGDVISLLPAIAGG